jgi:hypothetical protein
MGWRRRAESVDWHAGESAGGGGRLTPQQSWTAVVDKRQRSRTVVPDRTRRDRSWRQRCGDRFADPRGCPRGGYGGSVRGVPGDNARRCSSDSRRRRSRKAGVGWLEMMLGGAAATQGGSDRGLGHGQAESWPHAQRKPFAGRCAWSSEISS